MVNPAPLCAWGALYSRGLGLERGSLTIQRSGGAWRIIKAFYSEAARCRCEHQVGPGYNSPGAAAELVLQMGFRDVDGGLVLSSHKLAALRHLAGGGFVAWSPAQLLELQAPE